MHRSQFRKSFTPSAVRYGIAVAALLAAACSDQPSAPNVGSPGAPFFSTSGESGPPLYRNSEKYRDNGAKPATGRSGSASLTVRALLDKAGSTTVEVTTGKLDSDEPAPGKLDHVQNKAFDPNNTLKYTLNYRSLSGGSATFTYTGLARKDQVQVQANVSGIDPQRTDVVTVTDAVKLRPDLAPTALSVPAKAYVEAPVNVTATIQETNGDVGARANCVLYVDGVEEDRADNIWVDANGVVSCAFTPEFDEEGVYQVEVRVEGVKPGDYDAGNNSAQKSITIGSQFGYVAQVSDEKRDDLTYFYSHWNSPDNSAGSTFEYSERTTSHNQVTNWLGTLNTVITFPAERLEVRQGTGGRTIHEAAYTNLGDTYVTVSSSRRSRVVNTCVTRSSGTEIFYTTLCTHVGSRGGNPVRYTSLQYYRTAGEVMYRSRSYIRNWNQEYGYDDEGLWSWNYTYGYGNLIEFGDDFSWRVQLADDGHEYTSADVRPLRTYDQKWSQPLECYEGAEWWGSYKNCSEWFYNRPLKILTATNDGDW